MNQTTTSKEFEVVPISGGAALVAWFGAVALIVFCLLTGAVLLAIVLIVVTVLSTGGFFALQPNEARVLVLLGQYKGTVRKSGFHWVNPFYSRLRMVSGRVSGAEGAGALASYKVSLRARTFNMHTLKVNDKRGNPIEIAAVVVWRVIDTAQALFDVDDYVQYITTQGETALRHLASQYAYDNAEEDEITLRSNIDEVSAALCRELQERAVRAGVCVDEARLSHLAYAPEIAQVMLRRQQAEAVIAARQKIVHGAVSMVEMALQELSSKGVVTLDDERRATMVGNLMVVLCSEGEVQPIVNAGSLYN